MFAPVGFIPVNRVRDLLSGVASEIFHAEAIRRKSEVPVKDFWLDIKAGRKDFLLCRDLLEAWLMSRAFCALDVYAASPDGMILLIEDWALEHQERLDWYEWEWPDVHSYQGELATPLQIWREGFNPLSRFLFVDLYTCTLSVARRREWLWAEEERTGEDLRSLALALSPLDGWSICLKKTDVPASIDDLLVQMGISLPRLSFGGDPYISKRGRPAKVPQIAEAYIANFPDGHGSMQREEVRRVLQPIVKMSFSLDALDRAIKLAKSGS